ncbi:hypothetical protein [Paenibacillus glucanolyticus]|jgi:hypothetical protein|uniref:hypothetical protein n=1 Tax=Paenibacillus glucanolyticus TaxID=59843 RepID=UPI001E3BCAC2|nr:hypothetical protein [Paenibacillus glucanolyticus]
MSLEVIKDDHDPEDLIFSFTCSTCLDGYSVGWDEFCGDKVIYTETALKRLKRATEQ